MTEKKGCLIFCIRLAKLRVGDILNDLAHKHITLRMEYARKQNLVVSLDIWELKSANTITLLKWM